MSSWLRYLILVSNSLPTPESVLQSEDTLITNWIKTNEITKVALSLRSRFPEILESVLPCTQNISEIYRGYYTVAIWILSSSDENSILRMSVANE